MYGFVVSLKLLQLKLIANVIYVVWHAGYKITVHASLDLAFVLKKTNPCQQMVFLKENV